MQHFGGGGSGAAIRSRGYRFRLASARYRLAMAFAERVCRGNRHGDHTPYFDAKEQMSGPCFCERTRRRVDYIPF